MGTFQAFRSDPSSPKSPDRELIYRYLNWQLHKAEPYCIGNSRQHSNLLQYSEMVGTSAKKGGHDYIIPSDVMMQFFFFCLYK